MVVYYSKNALDAGNQQERSKIKGWITGFVDGKGAFIVSILRNSTSRTGWQAFPEFIVTQGAKSKEVLYTIQKFFNCGNVYVNRRFDNHNEDIYRYCVRSLSDLKVSIIPFFKENNLLTNKQKDFEFFCLIMDLINDREHLTLEGLSKIAEIAMKMNRKVPSQFLESSLTIRQTL